MNQLDNEQWFADAVAAFDAHRPHRYHVAFVVCDGDDMMLSSCCSHEVRVALLKLALEHTIETHNTRQSDGELKIH